MRTNLTRALPFTLAGLMLVSLITVSMSNGKASAATNRFVSPSGNDDGGTNTCTNPNQPCKTIQNAVNQSASGDTIELAGGTYHENVIIPGNQDNPPTLTIQGNPATASIVDGNKANSVFTIGSLSASTTSANVIFSMLTITNGAAAEQDNVSLGGGILAELANVTVNQCTISGNQAKAEEAGIGGGIGIAEGSLTVINSTITGNSSTDGGSIASFVGSLTAVNSTISGNSAEEAEGGGMAILENTVNMTNTIVAGNTGGDIVNITDIPITTNDHNFIGDGSIPAFLTGNPMLGPLQNNGGPTATMALLPGSRAIDAGDDSVLSAPFNLTTDQRGVGFARRAGAHVDIGAYEFAGSACLKDNSTGDVLQWNTGTGQYVFTRCSDGFTVNGTGTVGFASGVETLTDSKSNVRLSAGFSLGSLTGTATIYVEVATGVWQTFRINDTNPSAVCSCTR